MKKNKPKTKFQENFEAIIIAILLAFFIRTFVVEPFKIPSGSMIPTLLVGDHILVNKFIYGLRIPFSHKKVFAFEHPTRGDVIVFVYPLDTSLDFIKRVIGVEGDNIVIKGKKLYINGELYPDPHAHYIYDTTSDIELPRGDFGPITVPKNSLFVLGDNRDTSRDSRYWGYVPLDSVIGKAFIIYWSNGSNHNRLWWNYPMKFLDAIIYNR